MKTHCSSLELFLRKVCWIAFKLLCEESLLSNRILYNRFFLIMLGYKILHRNLRKTKYLSKVGVLLIGILCDVLLLNLIKSHFLWCLICELLCNLLLYPILLFTDSIRVRFIRTSSWYLLKIKQLILFCYGLRNSRNLHLLEVKSRLVLFFLMTSLKINYIVEKGDLLV